ncbi:MAG: motility protein A [Oscillospiraceae bacterium]|nr:motility protein A [Oscillospiraceae bacterium]
MDLSTIIGWILGVGLILVSIMLGESPETGATTFTPGNLMSFFDPASIAIVLGGTTAALLVSYPLEFFKKIPKHLKILFKHKKEDPKEIISEIVEFAKEARINGLLALEEKVNEVKDPFMKKSLMMVVDSTDPEKVRQLMETEIDNMEDRHSQAQGFYLKGSDYAPAFGMIGTLIGLINLLGNLSDSDSLAANMAVALITTLYGSFLANMLFKPIAAKLKTRHEEEILTMLIISTGIQAIQDGDNPNFIEEKLFKLLPKSGPVKKTGKSKGKGNDSFEDDGRI